MLLMGISRVNRQRLKICFEIREVSYEAAIRLTLFPYAHRTKKSEAALKEPFHESDVVEQIESEH